MIERHEDGVDDDADGDEHIDEGVGDEEFDVASENDPTATALPAESQLETASLQVFLARHSRVVLQLLRRYPAAQAA